MFEHGLSLGSVPFDKCAADQFGACDPQCLGCEIASELIVGECFEDKYFPLKNAKICSNRRHRNTLKQMDSG